jgi:hypothetical protein
VLGDSDKLFRASIYLRGVAAIFFTLCKTAVGGIADSARKPPQYPPIGFARCYPGKMPGKV